MQEKLLEIDISELFPDPDQPRKTFLDEELSRLAESIKARGILQPIRVSFDRELQKWRVITGESRWKAARIAGLDRVPCLITEGEPSPADLLADQIAENSVRHALRPVELADSLARLKALLGCNSQTLAAMTGLSGPAITRAEALLTLPGDVRELVDLGQLAESTAYEISRLPDPAAQREMARQTVEGDLGRDQVAGEVRGRLGAKSARPRSSRLGIRLETLSITLSSGRPFVWKELIEALDQVRREAKKLADAGKDVSLLAHAVHAR